MNETIRYCIDSELNFARSQFPTNRMMLAALTEEVGELAKALIDESRGKARPQDVFAEAVQVAVMAIRIAEEGSGEFPYQYEHRCYQEFNVNKVTRENI